MVVSVLIWWQEQSRCIELFLKVLGNQRIVIDADDLVTRTRRLLITVEGWVLQGEHKLAGREKSALLMPRLQKRRSDDDASLSMAMVLTLRSLHTRPRPACSG